MLEKNDSAIQNLSCGRLDFEDKSNLAWWSKKKNHWKVDNNCVIRWHKDGVTCDCDDVGTYALLRTTHYYMVSFYTITCDTICEIANQEEDMNSNVLHLSRDGFSVTSTLDTVVCIGICLSSVWSAGPIPGGVQKLWSSKSKTTQVFCIRQIKVLDGRVISKRYLLLLKKYRPEAIIV